MVSFLRNDRADDKGTPNPMLAAGQGGEGTGIRHTISFGGSQAGRYLRHFIELGLDVAELEAIRRPFTDGGQEVGQILRYAIRSGTAHRWLAGSLLAVLDGRARQLVDLAKVNLIR